MKRKNIIGLLLAMLVLLSISPVVGQFVSTGITRLAPPLANMRGDIQWINDPVIIANPWSIVSPLNLVLDKDQLKNIEIRRDELLVTLAEEHFVNEYLQEVLVQNILGNNELIVRMPNTNLVLFNDADEEIYNANYIVVVQTTDTCNKGEVCFKAAMLDSDQNLIVARMVKIFPNTGNLVLMGVVDIPIVPLSIQNHIRP